MSPNRERRETEKPFSIDKVSNRNRRRCIETSGGNRTIYSGRDETQRAGKRWESWPAFLISSLLNWPSGECTKNDGFRHYISSLSLSFLFTSNSTTTIVPKIINNNEEKQTNLSNVRKNLVIEPVSLCDLYLVMNREEKERKKGKRKKKKIQQFFKK